MRKKRTRIELSGHDWSVVVFEVFGFLLSVLLSH
jgi:hypothetical protein